MRIGETIKFKCWRGARMLSSIQRRTIVLSARYSAAGAYSSRVPGLRLALFVVLATLVFPLIPCLKGQAALAETSAAYRRAVLAQQQAQRKHNDGRLMILGGNPGTTYFNLAHDMAAALTGSNDLRLIAVDAPGGIESLRDLLLLRGVDLALVPGNVLEYADAMASFGPGLRERLTYITQLYGEEVHILVGPGTHSVENLRGKKVAVPPEDGNAEFTARDLLGRFRIDAEVVKVAAADAIDEVRSGTFAALVLMGGKPLRFVAALPKDGSLRLLALPSTQALGDDYSPSSFRTDDYPALIPEGQIIDTVSVGAVLVANNTAKWDDSNRRIARFIPPFFGALSELAGPRWHPKWGEVNLAANLTRWQRVPAAQEWLDRTLREQTASVQRDFEKFLSVSSPPGSAVRSPEAQRRLFEEYLKWTRGTTGVPNEAARH
jgi:TRAP-type uncharacterized transport system substrate-binding protein